MAGRPKPPEVGGAPGLEWRWRAGARAWVPYWVARRDLARQGYTPKTVRLHHTDAALIAGRCNVLQAEMLAWASGMRSPRRAFDGTMRALIDRYDTDPEGPMADVRENTRADYAYRLRILRSAVGERRIDKLTRSDLVRWYRELRAPAEPGGPERIRRAHGAMTMVRMLMSYGLAEGLPGCARVAEILSAIRFEQPAARAVAPTAAQVDAYRAAAHDLGWPSVALAAAIQFEASLRRKDVIGDWSTDDGEGGIRDRGRRWSGGLLWSDIGPDLSLVHTSAKRGRVTTHDLSAYPMVMEEIARATGPRVGPIIVCETTGRPWRKRHFQTVHARIAAAAGWPAGLWSMDLRAGAATEALASGAPLDLTADLLGHADRATTARYARPTADVTRRIARLRLAARTGSK